jgi:hypothetical protein
VQGCADFSSDSTDRKHTFTLILGGLHHHYVRV